MSRPEPKFSVDEPVMIRSRQNPDFNTNHSIIIERSYIKIINAFTGLTSTSWVYILNNSPPSLWVDESALRPIPKEQANGIDAYEFIQRYTGVSA